MSTEDPRVERDRVCFAMGRASAYLNAALVSLRESLTYVSDVDESQRDALDLAILGIVGVRDAMLDLEIASEEPEGEDDAS